MAAQAKKTIKIWGQKQTFSTHYQIWHWFWTKWKHPDLSQIVSPKTKCATKSRIKNKRCKTKPKKNKKLSPSNVSNIIRTKHIKTKCELYALAETQRNEGKTDLYDFIITKGSKKVSDLIATTLELQNAPSDLTITYVCNFAYMTPWGVVRDT